MTRAVSPAQAARRYWHGVTAGRPDQVDRALRMCPDADRRCVHCGRQLINTAGIGGDCRPKVAGTGHADLVARIDAWCRATAADDLTREAQAIGLEY